MLTQANTTRNAPAQIYGDAGLIYIRYHAQIETKPNGQNNIGGAHIALRKITQQIDYASGEGKCYSLLIGRGFKPGRWSGHFTKKPTRHRRAASVSSTI